MESEEKAASENAVEDSGKTESSYSKTNTREESVDEGDIVKTDGRYLYVVKEEGNEIGIVDTAENKLEQIEQITLGEEMKVSEIYVDVYKRQGTGICHEAGRTGKRRKSCSGRKKTAGSAGAQDFRRIFGIDEIKRLQRSK